MRTPKIISDILTFAVFNLSIRVRGIVFIPLISGTLGTAAFGAYTMLMAVSGTLELFFGLGLPSALVFYGQKDKYSISNLYYSYMAVSVVIGAAVSSVVFFLAAPLSEYTLGSPDYAFVYEVGSIMILFQMITRLGQNYYRAYSRIKLFSGLQAIRAYLSIGAVLYVVLVLDRGLGGVVLAIVAAEGVVAILTNLYPIVHLKFSIPTFPDFAAHLRYSLPLSFTSLTSTLESRIDRVLIGFWLGASAVGVYTMAYQICISISMYTTPIRETFFPEFSKQLEEKNYQQCAAYLQAGAKYFVVIAVPTAGGIYLIGQPVVELLLGGGQPVPSATLFLTISVGILLNGLARIFGIVLTANERSRTLFGIRLFSTLSNVVLNVALIPVYGILGAAIATLVTYVISVTTISYMVEAVPTPSLGLTALRTVVSTVLMIGIVTAVGIRGIVFVIPLSAITYSIGVIATGEIKLSEVRSIVVN